MPDTQSDNFRMYIPFSKVDEQSDGTLMVYGRATQEIPDSQNEIFDYEKSKPFFVQRMKEYSDLTKGHGVLPLSAMHNSKIAAGNVVNFEFLDNEKAIDAVSHVVDPVEIKKVKEHVYNGYSLGGKYKSREPDRNNPNLYRFTGDPLELSLVNKPAVPTAVFSFFKLDDSPIEDQKIESVPSVPPDWMLEFNKSMSMLADLAKAAQEEKDKQESELKALGERVGIPRRDGSPIKAPKGYPDDPSEYGDPANWNFPVDEKRHVQAVGRFNGGKGKEQYSPSARHAVGRRIARLASRFGEQYRYDRENQQIVNVKENKKMSDVNKLDVGAFLDYLKSLRDQVDDKEQFDLMVGKAAQLKDPSQTISIENPAVEVTTPDTPAAKTTTATTTAEKAAAKPPKKSPPSESSSETTETTEESTESTPTATSSKPPTMARKSDEFSELNAKVDATIEAVNKLASVIGDTMKKSAIPQASPLSELSSILSQSQGHLPLENDSVIKALEDDGMYAFEKALRAAGGDDKEDRFKRNNASNEVFTKLRQATIDELTSRGFVATLMADSHWRPLPPVQQ